MTDIHIKLIDSILAGIVQLSYVWLTAYAFRLLSAYLIARLQTFGLEPAPRSPDTPLE